MYSTEMDVEKSNSHGGDQRLGNTPTVALFASRASLTGEQPRVTTLNTLLPSLFRMKYISAQKKKKRWIRNFQKAKYAKFLPGKRVAYRRHCLYFLYNERVELLLSKVVNLL